MSKVPLLHYTRIIHALQRDGWIIVRQKGSHIRIQKRFSDKLLKVTVPAHKPVKRSTLSYILKQTKTELEDFLKLL